MARSEVLFGVHTVMQVLHSHPERVLELYVQSGREDARLHSVLQQAECLGLAVQAVARKTLDKLSEQGQHQGVLARCRAQAMLGDAELMQLRDKHGDGFFILVLDGVQDPHNLGACLRSADAAGIHAVVVPKDRAAGLSPTVRKVACGATETVPLIQVTNLARCLQQLKDSGVFLVGLAGEAERKLYDTNLTGALGLLLGAEEKGLRRLSREACDELTKIPMHGTVESLNVSVATGICLFEAVRQRHL